MMSEIISIPVINVDENLYKVVLNKDQLEYLNRASLLYHKNKVQNREQYAKRRLSKITPNGCNPNKKTNSIKNSFILDLSNYTV